MDIRGFVRLGLAGLISGYIGTRIMDPVTTKLQEMESEEDRQREEAVSPGVAYDIAARKISGAVGLQLSDKQVGIVATSFHYGLGLTAGEMYVLLRHTTRLSPLRGAGVVVFLLWAGVDEGVNTAFGFSAPPGAYPLATHLRSLLGHLALGLGVVVSAESLLWALRSQTQQHPLT